MISHDKPYMSDKTCSEIEMAERIDDILKISMTTAALISVVCVILFADNLIVIVAGATTFAFFWLFLYTIASPDIEKMLEKEVTVDELKKYCNLGPLHERELENKLKSTDRPLTYNDLFALDDFISNIMKPLSQ